MKDFKVRCIASGPCHDKGKIYDVVNGRIMKNDGKFSTCVSFHSVDKLNELWISKFELVEEEKMFTKDDLKVGYVVEYRNGEKAIVMPYKNGTTITDKNGYWSDIEEFNADLRIETMDEYDIMKVYGLSEKASEVHQISDKFRPLLWQREESPLELTIEEIAKKFGVEAGRVRIKESESK